jgi:SAM-dependent methyltransferase
MLADGWVDHVRLHELQVLVTMFPPQGNVLEIGAGSGFQARELSKLGHAVSAIDLLGSHAGPRFFEVQSYDGTHIPFPSQTFDVVFSSNVLEHVRDLDALLLEVKRVLKPGGYCVHAMPTPTWSIGNYLSGLADIFVVIAAVLRGRLAHQSFRKVAGLIWARLRPWRHGEHGNALTELWLFSSTRWQQVFRRNGYKVLGVRSLGFYYTGWSLLGAHLSMRARERVAAIVGSSCAAYVVKPTSR